MDATDDDPVRVERVDEADTALRRLRGGPAPSGRHRSRRPRPRLRRRRERSARRGPPAPARAARNGLAPAATAARASRARAVPRRDGLEVPAPAAAAERAVELDRDVAELAGHPVGTVEQPAVRDDRATDAGRHRQVDEVVLAAAGAVGRLAERGDVRVAVEERRAGRALPRRRRRAARHGSSDRGSAARRPRRRAGRPGRGWRCRCPMIDSRTSAWRTVARGDRGRRRTRRRPHRDRARWASRSRRGSVASRRAGRRRRGSGSRPGRAQGPVVTAGRNLEIAVWDRGHSSKGPFRPRVPGPPAIAGRMAHRHADIKRPPP